MGRKRTPNGRRVPVSFKLTETEAELVDSLRGETQRSVWLRHAAIAAAEDKRDSRIRESFGIGITVDDRQPPGVVSVVAPGEKKTDIRAFVLAPEEATPNPKNCRHPKVRVKGVCADCQKWVVK